MYQRYTGDLDELVKKRLIRVGVTYNRTNYFVDNGVQRGATYEFVKLFEDRLNAGIISEALNLKPNINAQDLTASQRAATSGLITALQMARGAPVPC